MTWSETIESTVNQYLVDPALRDEAKGRLGYRVPDNKRNRCVIIREVENDGHPYELPSPVLIGEFEDREVAEKVCDCHASSDSH
jgi:hypothetical protein